MESVRKPVFIIRLLNWEYWPWYIVYIPVFIFWLWSAVKVRALFWISAANPGFEYGGIVGASKKAILDKIPNNYLPKGLLIARNTTVDEVLHNMKQEGIDFPVILKPDIGERGFHVELLRSMAELNNYLPNAQEDYLLQEFLDMPVELGVFYSKLPGDDSGIVSSVVEKRLLKVTGDGHASIRTLMMQDERAVQQIARLEKRGDIDLDGIVPEGSVCLLEPIGNHVRGTAFLDGTKFITPELLAIFERISSDIEGFYYGRYDLRCESIEALLAGDFKVMELNGAASEPAHIYAPGFPLLKGYKSLFWHWRRLYKICRINHKNGVPYMSFHTGIEALKKSRFSRG